MVPFDGECPNLAQFRDSDTSGEADGEPREQAVVSHARDTDGVVEAVVRFDGELQHGAVAASPGDVPLLRALHDLGLIPRSFCIEGSFSQFRSRGTTDE